MNIWYKLSEIPPEIGKEVWCAYWKNGKWQYGKSRMSKEGKFRINQNHKNVIWWTHLPRLDPSVTR